MATNVAAPKNTGGGGFVFEDDVCAWLLTCMLAEEPPFGPELGTPVRIDFQTRPDGWFLDDALVTIRKGTVTRKVSLSIKSNAQFTAVSAPSDFVTCVWEQWLHLGSSVLRRSEDFQGLVTSPLSGAASDSVSGLTAKTRAADPTTFPGRIVQPGWASEDERHLFASFACPSTVPATTQPSDVDTASLLQRLRFLEHDFGAVVSESLKRALALCRGCVRSGSDPDRDVLWNKLRGIAAELRPVAGGITLHELVGRLREVVALADYPSYAADWASLDARSKRDAEQAADAVAGKFRLDRGEDVELLSTTLEKHELVALLGPSGVGKSVVARLLFERRLGAGIRTLWFDARSLDCPDVGVFESALRLQHALPDLLASATSADPVLVLDGLDRLYSPNAFRNAVALLRMARKAQPSTRWRVVAPCQSQEWPRILESLQRGGAPAGNWTTLPLRPLTTAQLKPVSDAMPALARLLLQPKIGALLTNLKLLDLVARRIDAGTDVDASSWVGESSVADWFWGAEIDTGPDRIARGRFARGLAQRQADELLTSIPTDAFEVSELAPLESLAADHLCTQVEGDRVAFAHDLYADWARLRILLNNRGALSAFLEGRRDSPLWHRALRLLGIHMLEHAGALEDWRAALATFGAEGADVLQDVLLEAPVFAVNAGALLDAVLQDLLRDQGRLLRRLLTRFLAFATVPDARMLPTALAVGMEPHTARAMYRTPYWPLWLDVLSFLHAHRIEVLEVAPSEVARVVEMWLAFPQRGKVMRAESAELAVLLGLHALKTRGTYGGEEWQRERQRFYTCALAAASERPEDVVTIALTASARKIEAPTTDEPPEVPAPRGRGRIFGGTGVLRGPWPDGPAHRVDEAFQNVVLDSAAIMPLYRARPAAAREVVLACLIQEPVYEDWNDHWMHRRNLSIVDRHKWSRALYTEGPFLPCLRENFEEGLELVARLVEFAAARAREDAQRDAAEWRSRALAEGHPEAQVDQRLAEVRAQEVLLLGDDAQRRLPADERIYGWSAGLGSPPGAVECALMALEQYFYLLLDEGKDVAAEAAAVLKRCESAALLGLLSDVGKRQRTLFEGPLRSLLSAPEIYAWEIGKLVQGRNHLMIGVFGAGEFWVKLAQQFHSLPHRKTDLRNLAVVVMFGNPAMREYFDRVRAEWSKGPSTGGQVAELRRQLLVNLDASNYEVRDDPEHGQVLVNVEALRVHEARADERRAMEEQAVLTGFPIRCRTVLDEGKQLDDARLAELWQQWARIRELAAEDKPPSGEERFGDEYPNAIMGGVAVFLWHGEWCGREEARVATVLEVLREYLGAPLQRSTFGGDDSVSTWTSDCFLAEAVAILWTREPSSPEWRRCVADAALATKYITIKLLFTRCAASRQSLGDDFHRLRRLVIEWAYIKDRVDLLRRVPREALQLDDEVLKRAQDALLAWGDEKIGAFVSGTMPGVPSDWTRCDEGHRFQELEGARRRMFGRPGPDFHVIRCAHEWLPLPNGAIDERERGEIVGFLRTALTFVIARPAADLKRRDHQYPGEDERWVLGLAGAVLLQLRDTEQPDLFWGPVLELHSEGHDWPEALLQSLHRNALASSETPAPYAGLVRAILQRAFLEVDGQRRWWSHERVWDSLIGVDGWTRDLWEERHEVVVRGLRDAFQLWMDQVPLNGRRLGGLASWLARPCATSLRLVALTWFAARVLVANRRPRDVQETEDSMAALLNVVWAEQQDALRRDASAFQAFRDLLQWLAARQNALGLELLGRLGSLS